MDKRELYNSYGTDDTPLNTDVDYSVDQYADFIMTKLHGRDVRGSLSFSLKKMDEVIDNTTSRQDTVEQQVQEFVDETTGKDVISAPEIIAARKGEPTLDARITKQHSEVTAQLAQKANQSDVANLSSTKPLFVSRLDEMTSESAIYVNTTDGYVYLYNSSSSSFENTGVLYQATGFSTNSIGLDHIKDDVYIFNYVTNDTEEELPLASAEPKEVRLNEQGNIYFSNGNMIDIIGMTDGTYTEDGLTVVVDGNRVKVTGTPSVNKYFKLSDRSGFVPNNVGLDERNFPLPFADNYTFGLYDVINPLDNVFTVSIRSTASGNFLQVNPSLTTPYKESNDSSLMGEMYMFFSADVENDTEFRLFFSPSTYDVSNEVVPSTRVYENVLKARNNGKYVLSDKTGGAKTLIPIISISNNGATSEVSHIYVESHSTYFNFYIKGSRIESNKYLRYTFEYWDGTSTNNGAGWVLGVVDVVEKVDGVFNVLYPVVKSGEWEMAIRLDGRPDFIGCKQHGSEVSFYNKFYIDGTEWVPDNSSFWCTEIKVVEKLTMYDPADEVTTVGTHRKFYTIDKEKINIKQRIEWSQNLIMGNNDVFVAMLPLVRGNDTTTPYQVSAKAYDDNTYEEIDVSVPSHSARSPRHEPNQWTLYSDSTGISVTMKSISKEKFPGANTFIQNSDSYNKVYFNYCEPQHNVAIGDVWENEINYELNINL